MIRDHNGFQIQNLMLIRPFTAVNETLKELRSASLRLALWTGRSSYVLESLEAAGVATDNFEIIVDPTATKHGKPDPEGIYFILKALHVQAENAVIVGDAAVDMLAGKNAGIAKTIAITHGFGTRKELQSATPDFIIDSLSELSGVIERLNSGEN